MSPTPAEKVLTPLFYLLTLATLVAYFATDNRDIMLYLGISAVSIRLITYFMRYFM